jgi:hypothetical protein
MYDIDIVGLKAVAINGISIKRAKDITISDVHLVTENQPTFQFKENENVSVD